MEGGATALDAGTFVVSCRSTLAVARLSEFWFVKMKMKNENPDIYSGYLKVK